MSLQKKKKKIVYDSVALLKSDVPGRKAHIQQAIVSTTRRISFSGPHPTNGGGTRTKKKRRRKERMGRRKRRMNKRRRRS